jgi:hypothetical protein
MHVAEIFRLIEQRKHHRSQRIASSLLENVIERELRLWPDSVEALDKRHGPDCEFDSLAVTDVRQGGRADARREAS